MPALTADRAAMQVRADVNRRKILDQAVVIVGLLVMFAALLVLAVLFSDLRPSSMPTS